MSTFALMMREAWVEVRAGLRSGIPLLVFLGLAPEIERPDCFLFAGEQRKISRCHGWTP